MLKVKGKKWKWRLLDGNKAVKRRRVLTLSFKTESHSYLIANWTNFFLQETEGFANFTFQLTAAEMGGDEKNGEGSGKTLQVLRKKVLVGYGKFS